MVVSTIFFFTPKIGEDEPIFDSYFSKGLKVETTYHKSDFCVYVLRVFYTIQKSFPFCLWNRQDEAGRSHGVHL